MSFSRDGQMATVFGGSGFVGRHVVRAFAARGWRVRAAVRRPDLAGHLQPMGTVGQIHGVQANVRFPDSARRAAEGAAAVVNLVGVLESVGAQNFQAVHVVGARAVARAAREAGAARLVHVSALGADVKSPSQYARTKAEGEAAAREEFPGVIILRPSIVFGPEDDFFNRFAAMARLSPFLPLIGGGKTKFQPVFVDDLAAAVVNAAEGRATPGAVYEIGGPETLTFRELLDRTQAWAGRSRAYFPLPFWAAKLQAIMTSPLPASLRPVTLDQLRLLETDNVVSAEAIAEGRTLAQLADEPPRSIGAIVPAYLERFKPRGEFERFRG